MAKFCALKSQGDDSLVGLPVFPSRMFRHSSMYVRRDSGISSPEQLTGRRVGIPEWAQTAAVYTRGLLAHKYGVPLTDVTWFQAGVNQPGRKEKVRLSLPEGLTCTSRPDRSLSSLLLDGDVDAVFSAHAPDCFFEQPDVVVRLVPDPAVERRYWDESGVYPIMHTIAIRREVVDAHPWVPVTLFKGFQEARRRSLERITDMTASRYPVPWLQSYAESAWRNFPEGDPWPYGVAGNRTTLEAFLRFGAEQGVFARVMDPEELFARQIGDLVRV
jgi:4,5-dihydroxyphthalate decarboxylase